MPDRLQAEIRWFEQEIDICQSAIRELQESDGNGPGKDEALARLLVTLQSHQQSLAELRSRLTPGDASDT